MVASAARIIFDSLDNIPNGDGRTKIAFITFDRHVHYYDFKGSSPQIIICCDIDEVFIPKPEDILVNLKDTRPKVEELLSKLGSLHASTQEPHSGLGVAMKAAKSLIVETKNTILKKYSYTTICIHMHIS